MAVLTEELQQGDETEDFWSLIGGPGEIAGAHTV